jgi:predicted enzyme related to lactoylglutathione lyase
MSTNVAAANAFYASLFGWAVEVGPAETGNYGLAKKDGKNVAGTMGAGELPHPAVWTTYLATDDAAATCEAITAAGGTVVSPPMDVMDLGVMAVATDPTGATFGIWQARAHTGFQLANEPGAVIWNEQLSRDLDAAKAFYSAVFGYTYGKMGDDDSYAMIEVDGNTVGGIGAMPAEIPAGVPPHWRAYFSVENADAAAEQVASLGGKVLSQPQDMPYGRHADIADPNGAMLAILQNPPASE